MGEARIFRLYILGAVADERPVTTLAEFGPQRALERVDIPEGYITDLADRIQSLRSYVEGAAADYAIDALRELGEKMFNLVIQRSVRELLGRARGARQRQKLPFELVVEDPVALGWPWEYMFDPGSDRFICQAFNPISRTVITLEGTNEGEPAGERLRVLVLVGIRPNDPLTPPDEQIESIKTAFKTWGDEAAVSVEVRGNTDPADLGNLLHSWPCDVLHFYGHAGVDEEGGFLRFERQVNGDVQICDKPAEWFAQVLNAQPTKLVFLNACQTAVGASAGEASARNSVAMELMRNGMPAVIATQFKMPANRSHRFASLVYSAIAGGREITDAIVQGRSEIATRERGGRFVDWGIPVLYARDPHSILLERRESHGQTDVIPPTGGGSIPVTQWQQGGSHSVGLQVPFPIGTGDVLTSTIDQRWDAEKAVQPAPTPVARKKVALLDADADIGRLPDVVAAANAIQTYFHFEIHSYDLSPGDVMSSKAVLDHLDGIPVEINPLDPLDAAQLYVPHAAEHLAKAPEEYRVDYVCCLTSHRVATIEDGALWANCFIAGADMTGLVPEEEADVQVNVVSVHGLRQYAKEAKVSVAKAAFYLCVASVLDLVYKGQIEFHRATHGCLFDECFYRQDIVDGLTRMRFDHRECLDQVDNPELVEAINAMLDIPDTFEVAPAVDPVAIPELDAGVLGATREIQPNGVDVRTGGYAAEPVEVKELAQRARHGAKPVSTPEAERLVEQGRRRYLDVRAGVDGADLAQAGWGIVFPESVDPEPIRLALRPLLDLRKSQATAGGLASRYREYTGAAGYHRGEQGLDWLLRNGMGPGRANPDALPYYLLLVGSAEEIPFEFQLELGVEYAVGRLCFDEPADYARYAAAALAAAGRRIEPRAVFFGTRNPGDRMTRLSATELVAPLATQFKDEHDLWNVETVLDRRATKVRLMEVMHPSSAPALIFTATHGAAFPSGDPLQQSQQGALICQEWSPLNQEPVPPTHYFSSADLRPEASLVGSILFNFACFSAGTPMADDLPVVLGKPPVPLAPQPFVAQLPQRLLCLPGGGPLAVIGHIDRAYPWSFRWPKVEDHRMPFQSALRELAKGVPVGHAMREFPSRFSHLLTTLDLLKPESPGTDSDEADSKVAGWWTACRDARNYLILGDPASRLTFA